MVGFPIRWWKNIFNSLSLCLLPGLAEANVLHRDLKTDNLLYLPNYGTVVACDFGVGFIINSEMKPGPRGALKYYTVQAGVQLVDLIITKLKIHMTG